MLPPLASQSIQSVAVVGAGVVGLSCALWLQKAGHRVTLIDPAPPKPGHSFEQASSFGNACTMAVGACIPVATTGTLRSVPRMLVDRQGPLSLYWRDLFQMIPWLIDFIRSSSAAEVSRIVGVLGNLLRLAEDGHAPLFADARADHLKRHNGCLYLYRNRASFKAAEQEIAFREREGVGMRVLDREVLIFTQK